jgi:hypothetical protein
MRPSCLGATSVPLKSDDVQAVSNAQRVCFPANGRVRRIISYYASGYFRRRVRASATARGFLEYLDQASMQAQLFRELPTMYHTLIEHVLAINISLEVKDSLVSVCE